MAAASPAAMQTTGIMMALRWGGWLLLLSAQDRNDNNVESRHCPWVNDKHDVMFPKVNSELEKMNVCHGHKRVNHMH